MIERVSDRIVLVGTAHVSPDSVEEVREVIAEEAPDVVAVELDERRRESLMQGERFRERPVSEMIRDNRAAFFIAHILLNSYQRKLGEEFGAEPGAEMKAAIEAAEASGAELVLADRKIGVTLRRAWSRMGLREKLRLVWEFMKAMVGLEEAEEVDLEELMDEDVLTMMMEELAEMAPSIKEVLIDERDAYLAERIRQASRDGTVVAVVGAGHLQGIRRHLEGDEPVDLEALEHVPTRRVSWGKVAAYSITAVIVGIFAWLAYQGYVTGSYAQLLEGLKLWILFNGAFAAIGALIARGHPLSIATAFAAAPITSLNPSLAAGWFAGLVEVKMRKPTVGDFEALAVIETFKDWVDNNVTRVLLVTAFANVGSVIGTALAGAYLVDLLRRSLGV